jgi:lysophospholipase L1-like esterase
MKRTIFSFIVIGMIISLYFSGCDNGTAANIFDANNTGISLVCLGDSLTAGHGATTPGVDDETKSYPAYLQAKINIPVVNAGITGNTTAQALFRTYTDVIKENPRIVIIELGGNDLFQGVPPETTKNNLQKIINLVNNGKRKIYIARFYTEEVARSMADSVGINNYSVQTFLITQYNTMFYALAASNNVELITDIWEGVWGIHMSDVVHPDAKGYEIMADNYYKAMEPYLKENNLLK